MSTLYALFKVPEDATSEEITKAYQQILQKADSLPQTEKLIEQIRRIKIAYGILSNPQKRKKYDLDLATKRADELLENVQLKKEEKPEKFSQLENPIEDALSFKKKSQVDQERMKQMIAEQINQISQMDLANEIPKKKQPQLTPKQQKRQWRKEKRNARKKQELKREMEIQAYGQYLENQGYHVKYPWTWPRVKRLIRALIFVVITIIILWQIPFVKNTCIALYQENFIIQFFVDMVVSLFKAIANSVKSIFQFNK